MAEEASRSLHTLMAALWLVIANAVAPTGSCLQFIFQRMILKTAFLKLSWLSRTDWSVFRLHYFLQKLLTLVSWGHFLPSVILKSLLETNSEPWTRVGEYQSCLYLCNFFSFKDPYTVGNPCLFLGYNQTSTWAHEMQAAISHFYRCEIMWFAKGHKAQKWENKDLNSSGLSDFSVHILNHQVLMPILFNWQEVPLET